MSTFFSVIIPLYNKQDYIEATLKSVLDQSFQNFEVIIVDDGSTDDSFKLVSNIKDKRLRLYQQKNMGVSSARNYGIQKAKSDYIALIDADDFWYGDHLFELKKQIELFPNNGLFCNNYEINYDGHFIKPAHFKLNFGTDILLIQDFFSASITNCVAWTSSVGFSKKIYLEVGGFDLSLQTAQDLDLWIRIALNYSISFNPKITMRYNFFVGGSLSKNEFNDIRYNFISKYSKEETNNPSLKTYLDINRYALAIRSILNDDKLLYEKVKNEINQKNLNLKQRFLLRMPKQIIKLIKQLQRNLIKGNVYLTAYK